MVKENLAIVEQNIQKACVRSGRDRREVQLIAVSKTKPVEMLMEAYDCQDSAILVRISRRKSGRNSRNCRKISAGT